VTNEERITLITRNASQPDVDWNYQRARTQRVAFLDSMASLEFVLGAALNDVGLDVERIIVDRAAEADQYLDLLASTPDEFAGDVVLIRQDGSGFLSATGRGGNRVLYAMSAKDVRFYLEAHDLVTGRAALPLSA
jgi:hypothetical protein